MEDDSIAKAGYMTKKPPVNHDRAETVHSAKEDKTPSELKIPSYKEVKENKKRVREASLDINHPDHDSVMFGEHRDLDVGNMGRRIQAKGLVPPTRDKESFVFSSPGLVGVASTEGISDNNPGGGYTVIPHETYSVSFNPNRVKERVAETSTPDAKADRIRTRFGKEPVANKDEYIWDAVADPMEQLNYLKANEMTPLQVYNAWERATKKKNGGYHAVVPKQMVDWVVNNIPEEYRGKLSPKFLRYGGKVEGIPPYKDVEKRRRKS